MWVFIVGFTFDTKLDSSKTEYDTEIIIVTAMDQKLAS